MTAGIGIIGDPESVALAAKLFLRKFGAESCRVLTSASQASGHIARGYPVLLIVKDANDAHNALPHTHRVVNDLCGHTLALRLMATYRDAAKA